MSKLNDRIREAPARPGVYMFLNDKRRIIYVGKARSIKDRLRSYAGEGGDRGHRIRKMIGEIADLQYIVTGNEVEALSLENNLIKEHHPRYNVLLRDDKTYPYIMMTTSDPFPRPYVVRRVKKDGNKYFGPVIPGGKARRLMRILFDSFNLRQCRGGLEDKSARACLFYQMGKCGGPCSGIIGKREYNRRVEDAVDFLRGKGDELVGDLRKRMKDCAERLEYEKAAYYRDLIDSVEVVAPGIQRVSTTRKENLDVLAVEKGKDRQAIQFFIMRDGEVRSQKRYFIDGDRDIPEEKILRTALLRHYQAAEDIPPKIVLPGLPEDEKLFRKWFGERRGKRVVFHVPCRGEKQKLLEMARVNAAEALKAPVRTEDYDDSGPAGLDSRPERIDAFDVSNLGDSGSVASMVVWKNGFFTKSEYRRFEIKGVDGADDPASIKEAVGRRYGRVKKEALELPDLILVDGGVSQVNAACTALEETGMADLPVIGIAKRKEHLFLPGRGKPLDLPDTSSFLLLLRRIRDEAHRFALDYHRRKRKKKMFSGELEKIEGVGGKTASRLLKAYGSVEGVAAAGESELARLISRTTARNIKDYFKKKSR